MDVYQKALRNPDSPNKSNSHSRTPLIDSGRKVSFIPGVPSINQIRQEPRLLQPMQPLPALVELQPHRTTFAPGFPPQQQAFPVPTYTQQQQQQPQQLQVPNHGSTQLMTNNSVTNIQQSQSPVLVNTPELRQQQQQQQAQLQHDLSSKRKRNSRRKHRNSHLGCGTCKRRRIKCDETLPSCLNCMKGKLHCAYLNLDNHARNALRLAQYNQSMRQDRLDGSKAGDEQLEEQQQQKFHQIQQLQQQQHQQQQQQQQVLGGASLLQQQTPNGPVLATVGNAPPPPHQATMVTNCGTPFIPTQQPLDQGAALPPTAVMQSPYGPISLVPVLTNTGAVVYAPTSALPSAAPPVVAGASGSPMTTVSQQPTPAASQVSILTNPPPPQQQQTPGSMRGRATSILSTSSTMGPDSTTQSTSSVSPTQRQRQQNQRLPSLTPITSTAANAATLASQNIHIKTQLQPQLQPQQDQQSLNTEVKLPPIPLAPISVPSINVSKSDASSVSPSLKSDSDSIQALQSAPVLSPISMNSGEPKVSPSLPSISQMTKQPTLNATIPISNLQQQLEKENNEAENEEQQRRDERVRVYSRSEPHTSSLSRSRSRSPTRSTKSRSVSPQLIANNVIAANAVPTATTTTTALSENTATDVANSSLKSIPKPGSVSNFGSLSINEEKGKEVKKTKEKVMEQAKNGDLKLRLPLTGVEVSAAGAGAGAGASGASGASGATRNGSQEEEEKVSISKLIT